MHGLVNSDFANDADRKLYIGYVILVNNTPIQWKSKKQNLITLSSTEAEYVGFGMVVQEILWIQSIILLRGAELLELLTKVFCDN